MSSYIKGVMKNPVIIIAIVAVLVGASAFYGGMKYQQTQTPVRGSGQFGAESGNGGGTGSQRGTGQGRNGGRPTVGEIMSVDDKSITVKMMDGSSKIILLTNKTAYTKTTDGAKGDLKVGLRVAVTGTDNSDGSVTATNIQENPTFGFGGGSRAPNPSSNP